MIKVHRQYAWNSVGEWETQETTTLMPPHTWTLFSHSQSCALEKSTNPRFFRFAVWAGKEHMFFFGLVSLYFIGHGTFSRCSSSIFNIWPAIEVVAVSWGAQAKALVADIACRGTQALAKIWGPFGVDEQMVNPSIHESSYPLFTLYKPWIVIYKVWKIHFRRIASPIFRHPSGCGCGPIALGAPWSEGHVWGVDSMKRHKIGRLQVVLVYHWQQLAFKHAKKHPISCLCCRLDAWGMPYYSILQSSDKWTWRCEREPWKNMKWSRIFDVCACMTYQEHSKT